MSNKLRKDVAHLVQYPPNLDQRQPGLYLFAPAHIFKAVRNMYEMYLVLLLTKAFMSKAHSAHQQNNCCRQNTVMPSHGDAVGVYDLNQQVAVRCQTKKTQKQPAALKPSSVETHT